jgi:hypothetical protein
MHAMYIPLVIQKSVFDTTGMAIFPSTRAAPYCPIGNSSSAGLRPDENFAMPAAPNSRLLNHSRYRSLLLTFLSLVVFGYSYPCVDINFTPYSGAENLIFLQNGMEKIDNLIHPIPDITAKELQNPDQCPYFTKKEQWLRQAKSILVWIPINASCVVTQHEVFGHGYRVRDLGPKYAKVTGYKMYVYGGSTSIDITHQLTTSQELAIDIGGVEADAILANKIRLKWLDTGRISGRQSLLYLLSSLSLTGYSFTVKKNPTNPAEDGNDISNFLFYLNSTYQDSYLGYTKLRNLSLINLLDPFLYYSIFSNWIYTAFSSPIKIPMFKIGSLQYLPSARLALTPFGLQCYLENFVITNKIPTYLYVKYGKNGNNIYYGLGIENQRVFHWKSGSLGFRMDVWHQPNVLFQQGALSVQEISTLPKKTPLPRLYPTSILTAKSIGGAFCAIGSYSWERWPIRIFTELGYKTSGYLPGEALRESLIARGGLSGEF